MKALEIITEAPQRGQPLDIEFGDLLIETEIVDVTEDGVVVHLDETAMQLILEAKDRRKIVAEGKKKPDRYHIVGKDGKPVNLASYPDEASAKKDRDEKYTGAVVQQVGPRGKVKGVAEGGIIKSIKRGMAGWGAFDKDKPADVVKRVKGQDTDTLKGLSRTGPTGRGSPAELQQKAISRELKKRGEQGVTEGLSENAGSSNPAQILFQLYSDVKEGGRQFFPHLLRIMDRWSKEPNSWNGDLAKKELADIQKELDRRELPLKASELLKNWSMIRSDTLKYLNKPNQPVSEAKSPGRTVPRGKRMAGDVKKFKVYVKNKKGNVIKVNFGQKGVKIKKNNPGRRKSFRARHNCATAKDRTTPRYWSCRAW